MQTCSTPLSCCVSLHLTKVQLSDVRQGQLKSRTGRRQTNRRQPPLIEEHLSCPFVPATPRHARPHAQSLSAPNVASRCSGQNGRNTSMSATFGIFGGASHAVMYLRQPFRMLGGLKHRILPSDRYAITNHRFVSCFCKRQEVCNQNARPKSLI